MAEQAKFIVKELNKEPFNKNFNLISFDRLDPLQLLQVLNDVLSHIEPKQKMDIREESSDQTAIRIFTGLRRLKFKPSTDDVSAFRTGLVQGEKPIVYPILEWILKNVTELQKRAHLSKFLMKLNIPDEFLAEEQIGNLYAQYEELIEQFKELHRQAETLRTSGYNTAEIRKDIANMEEEKEQLLKRIERLKRKVESHPNSQSMMNVAKNLRLERDKEKKLGEQKQEHIMLLQHEEQRLKRVQKQLSDSRQASVGATPEGMLKRTEEEMRAHSYIVKERLPKDIAARRKTLQDLQKVAAEPAMGLSDLDDLRNTIQKLNSEVNQLVEKRMRTENPTEDKLSLFRQQAAIISHKKAAIASTLRETREEYSHTMQALEQKQEQARNVQGGEILKGDDFKRYVSKLRSKSTVYKKKRQEIAELRAEVGVLSRSEEVLKQREDLLNQQLSVLENKKGVSGYRLTQENLEKVSTMKSELDETKGKTLEDMSDMVRRLTNKIADRKNSLAPIIKELRPLRQRAQELTGVYEAKKQAYDTAAAGLESNMTKLEQEVRAFQEECLQEESRYHYLHCMMQMHNKEHQKVEEELKAYKSSDSHVKRKTFRDIYQRKIQEQENLGKGLREKQKTVRDNQNTSLKQMKMWKDLDRLFECKRQCFERSGGLNVNGAMLGYEEKPPAILEDDRLVL